jgi:chromate transport protein ChrA
MIYIELFLGFLKVGCFAFGGAYGAIPLIRDVVLSYGWLNDEMLTYMIAVSESTPGPIMVNMATYVGSVQAGFFGAVVATFGVVLPSFCVMLKTLYSPISHLNMVQCEPNIALCCILLLNNLIFRLLLLIFYQGLMYY